MSLPSREKFASDLRWWAIGAVPFSALAVSIQTAPTGHAENFGRAVAVWIGFAALHGVVELLLKPKSLGGWSRFFAFAACGAVDGLWSAQWMPLSLGDASPIQIGPGYTLSWMLGSAWIKAMTNIDRTNPPKLPSFGDVTFTPERTPT